MLKGTCIGFLPDAGCGLIYADDDTLDSRIVFVHFRDVEPEAGWQGLESGDRVEFCADKEHGHYFYRDCAAKGQGGEFVQKLKGEDTTHLVTYDLKRLSQKNIMPGQQLVVTGDIPDKWVFPRQILQQKDVLFSNCSWEGKAVFPDLDIKGDLVFLGCSFPQSFSLRGAKISGTVHMEGCDFSGTGGASFRGLQAKGLYLDFGVKGPQDMVWLNEMCIQENVVVGGEFSSSIQVMRVQDERVCTQTCEDNESCGSASFRHLYVGKEFYKSQNANRTRLHGMLDIQGLSHGECIHIEYAEIGDLNLFKVAGNVGLDCKHSKVLGHVLIQCETECKQAAMQNIDFEGTYVEGHFTVRHAMINGVLNLDDATVGQVTRLHKVLFGRGGGMQLARLCANRLVMNDFSSLHGVSKQPLLGNKLFYMLNREKQGGIKDQEDLVQEYVLLKNLLSQEGQLELEDEAFYNMRKLANKHSFTKTLFLNYIFGWGVRLKNIVASVSVLTLFFTSIYLNCFPKFSFSLLDALQLSLQSIFLAFFGAVKPEVFAGSWLSWVVLVQSILGVIFVTVFVGAYVRKLLR